ncbi:MAG TPA: PAS domain-containing sensor histidine kinase [Allosphingosinicella sp.]|nr:PAS domain-containing sensor histidine kinase [Allosphingosinicella sp.]
MTPGVEAGLAAVRGRVDSEGRLVEADPPLADLHSRAGGKPGGVLAVPQVAALARLAQRLGIVVSRPAIASDGARDLDLWVRAEPAGDWVDLSISGWTERPTYAPDAPAIEREPDFVRAAVDWVWETDESLRLTMLSAGATAALGRPSSLMVGQPLTGLFRFREQECGALPILTALAERQSFEGQLAELRSGSRDSYRLSGVPLIDGTGRFAGFRGSATNVTAALRESAANDEEEPAKPAPSAFGDRLDTALRSPLRHIVTHAETMAAQADGPLAGDYHGYAVDIASAGRHLLSLVDDLVDLEAIERPGFRPAADPVDLAEVARQVVGLLGLRASQRNVRIEGPPADLQLPATGEYRRALQVLMNLLTNAIRYSPEGGIVRISAASTGGFASVTVTDSGKGLSKPDQARIFEKFERVDPLEPGGTGLGLYIARRLARAMGGDLTVESAPGEGASFTFSLPVDGGGSSIS